MAFKFEYHHLGPQPKGSRVLVRLRGTAANVMLLDAPNFARYKSGDGFKSTGRFVRRSPVELTVPRDADWFLVLDLGGYAGRVRVLELTVVPPDESAVPSHESAVPSHESAAPSHEIAVPSDEIAVPPDENESPEASRVVACHR